MNNFDVFRTHDNTVSKYIHDDGSETSIKVIKSIQNIFNPLTRELEELRSERNKYSVFISSSVGCFMKCKFCHLTLKNASHEKLESAQVLENLKQAIEDSVQFNPELKKRFIKLSWMGMGDAINKPQMVYDVTLELLEWVMSKGYAQGLDGVDLSTVMPKMKNDSWIDIFWKLEEKLEKYKINPVYEMDNVQWANYNKKRRNVFRLFYSVESAIQESREFIVPNAMSLEQATKELLKYSNNGEYTVILHHLLIDSLNDTDEQVNALADFINNNFINTELRVLRYNYCAKSSLKESEKFNSYIQRLSDKIEHLKVQVSPGDEVSAACGQFIVKDFIRSKKKIPIFSMQEQSQEVKG